MNAAFLLYPLLVMADVLLIVGATGRVRLALFVFLTLHVLCWLLAGKETLRTLGFYVSLGLAWLVIGGYALDAPFLVRSAVAVAILFVAFPTWGNGSVGAGFRPPKYRGKSGLRRVLGFGLPLMALGAFALLLMADPIPRSSKAIMDMGSGLRDLAAPLLGGFAGTEDGPEAEELNPTDGEGGTENRDFGVRRKLPNSANLRMGNDLHVFLQFAGPDDFAKVIAKRPYVRQLVLNGYAAGEWFHIPGAERLIADEDDGNTDGKVQPRPAKFDGIPYDVYALNSTGRSLPFIPGVVEASFPNMVEVLDGWYQAGIPGNVTYSAVSEPVRFEDISTPTLRSGVTTREYLEINDRELLRRLRGLLAQTGSADLSLRQKLTAIRDFMHRNYAYSTVIENAGALPPIENFLFSEKKGYCDFFATAGALLCRAMGLPARTAYGFARGELHRSEQILSFRGNHAHSWTEIYLDGFGWVIFDLTPPGAAATASESPDSTSPAPDPTEFVDARSQTDEGEDKRHPFLSFLDNIPPKTVYIVIAAWLGLMLASRLLSRVQGGKERDKARSRRHRKGKRDALAFDYDPYPAYFLDFRKLCRLLGCRDDDGDTLRELMRKLGAQGIQLGSEFDTMQRYHYGVRYEGHRSDPGEEKQYRRLIRSFWKERKE